ncbi:LYR motif-containing protein 4 isoform X1 [Monodelphis domestica]|uniref:LYR motif containing 4 n=1 Tax=Monodelphis domestica TaxID=13616 RepID=A0A5F8H234_MONDO|nr:LYR motif-containing protein 4 isoform X1 [Monodelphis domestica]
MLSCPEFCLFSLYQTIWVLEPIQGPDRYRRNGNSKMLSPTPNSRTHPRGRGELSPGVPRPLFSPAPPGHVGPPRKGPVCLPHPLPPKMAASSRAQVLDLYRVMLRESSKFASYNYRTYAIRRIREAFRENKNVKDPAQVQILVNKAKRNLEVIQRQVPWYSWMSQLYPTLVGQHSLLSTILKAMSPQISSGGCLIHISQLYLTDKLIIENQKPKT